MADLAATAAALLAQTRVRNVSEHFQEEWGNGTSSSQLWLLAIPLAAVAIGWATARWVNRPRSPFNTPLDLFTQLQRAHRINRPQRKLLARIAEEAELAQPATLMLGPAAFDQAVERASTRLRLDRRQQNRLAQLRRQLFLG